MHTIDPASSARARCRGCGRTIAKGELRFGERLPNPFSEGNEMTHWFHLTCAAMKRPEVLLETLAYGEMQGVVDDEANLRTIADTGIAHRRLPRVNGAERSPSGRARCRHCRETIDKDAWRIGLVFYEEGQFNPGGFIHATCANDYFEQPDTTDLMARITNFAPDLTSEDRTTLQQDIDVPA